ncbi:hypothetical protein BDN70DRAFT_859523 [Pholiota conissans]|uniref:Uncharacterized protein n=1 Tax=Pholiota conissans TaxID=109636 RepID=A0A9P6CSZ3_9AGAR|nr:hypothetical protein BDN70DRAFT_859523 [Pholiota conissans]
MWPAKILRLFQTVPPNPSDCDFLGPFNALLYTLFPPETDFVVVPTYSQDPDSVEFTVMFEVRLFNDTFLIVELNPPGYHGVLSRRQIADDQIRIRMRDIFGSCPLETLHGVSAFGTKLCFYSIHTRDKHPAIMPFGIPSDPVRLNDTAPASRWDCDILELAGEERFRAVVEEIKAVSAALA